MFDKLMNNKAILVVSAVLALTACSQKNLNNSNKASTSLKAPKKYKVQSGDTVGKIAQRYGLDWRSVSKLNNLDSNHTIYVGQILTLKGANSSNTTTVQNEKSSKKPVIVSGNNQNTQQNQPSIYKPNASTNTPNYLQNASLPASNTKKAPFVGSSAVMKFSYPVGKNNAVVKNFGTPTQNGLTEGLFFSGRDGDAVTASLDGVVIGVGDGLAGRAYVLVEHNNGYKSAYLDLKNISVRTGQSIQRYQPVGQMQSQTASGLALFEFRIARQGQYIDPVSVLK